jgi:hypothetical protein
MSRLVDADELREHLFVGADYDRVIDDGIYKTEEEVFAFKCGWNDALKSVVQFAPTVDAVPVVRCKDCKKYIPCQKLPIGTSKWCDLFDRATCEMNYCGWGERRKDEIG